MYRCGKSDESDKSDGSDGADGELGCLKDDGAEDVELHSFVCCAGVMEGDAFVAEISQGYVGVTEIYVSDA